MSKKNELQKAKLIISYKAKPNDPGKNQDEDYGNDFEEEDIEELKDDDENDINGDDVENIHIYDKMKIFYTLQRESTFEIDPSYK